MTRFQVDILSFLARENYHRGAHVVMIVAVQFVYCYLKEVLHAILFGYNEGNQENFSGENSACYDHGKRTRMVQVKDAQGEWRIPDKLIN